MPSERVGDGTVRGEVVEPGRARIEDTENPDAWIEAEYRDGWARRKIIGGDNDEYESMIHAFYLRCAFCRRWRDPQMWGAGSEYCPRCEQWHDFILPRLFSRMFDEGGEEEEAINYV